MLHGAAGQAAGRPTVVFLHYFAGSGLEWAGVADRLAGVHPGGYPDAYSGGYRCVAPDLRGHGDSAAPAGGPPSDGYAVADRADDIAGVVAALGIRDYVLVGHSTGGKLALALAARRPPGLRARVVAGNLRTAPPAWRAWLERGSREDFSALAPHVEVPALVVAGDADHTIPTALVEREVIP